LPGRGAAGSGPSRRLLANRIVFDKRASSTNRVKRAWLNAAQLPAVRACLTEILTARPGVVAEETGCGFRRGEVGRG